MRVWYGAKGRVLFLQRLWSDASGLVLKGPFHEAQAPLLAHVHTNFPFHSDTFKRTVSGLLQQIQMPITTKSLGQINCLP